MRTPPHNLSEIFNTQVIELHATEKKYLKVFEQLSNAAQTPELRAALSSEKSGQEDHVSRLLLVIDSLKLKHSRVSNSINEELLKLANEVAGYQKQQSIYKDIQILQLAKLIFSAKSCAYSSLQLIAENRGQNIAADIMAQSLADIRNNLAYLLQIEQNIVYPAAAKID